MVKQAQLDRGKKWLEKKAELEFLKERGNIEVLKDLKWMEEQKSIQDDIKAYKDSLEEKTKSKKEK